MTQPPHDRLRLMAVMAHPDDETLGIGGSLALYASEGVETFVLCATRGQKGRHGTDGPHPGPEALGRIREAELRAAARELGVSEVSFLDYMDAHLDEAETEEAMGRIVAHLLRVRPQVVITFGPEGAYGHADHVAISQLTTAACVAAATPRSDGDRPHVVAKLYYLAWTADTWTTYQAALKRLTTEVDGVVRQANPWPDWAVTTRIDARPWWRTVWRAVQCHQTQMSLFAGLERLPEEAHAGLWGDQTFYRAYSTVNGGRTVEHDLFEGLR